MNRPSIATSVIFSALALSFTACSKQAVADKPAEKTPAAAVSTTPAKAETATPVAAVTPVAATPATVAPAAATPAFESLDQKVSYGIGYNIGSGLAREKAVTVDEAAVRAGLADGLSGAKTRISETELRAAFATVQQKAMAEQQKAMAEAAAVGEKQKAIGTEFLAKNKTRPGVITTASGLQYEVITSGTGAKPKATDTVQVHYHGTLIDGTVFDSSVESGTPAEFPVTGVIPGWVEALQLMSVGDKWKLYVPADIAYGPSARGKIPANAVLIFEVQLLAIK